MNFDRFYLFESQLKRGSLILTSEPVLSDPFSILAARVRPDSALKFVHHMGGKVHDVIDTGYAIIYLVNELQC